MSWFAVDLQSQAQELAEDGQGEQLLPGSNGCSPNKIIGGASNTSCSPNFFSVTVKSNLQSVRLLNIKILQNSPSSGGFAPDPTVHCMYLFWKIHTAQWYFESDCLECFSPIFAPPTEKSFPCLLQKQHKWHEWSYRHSVVPLYSGLIAPTWGAEPAGKSDTLKYERLLLTKPSSVPVSL